MESKGESSLAAMFGAAGAQEAGPGALVARAKLFLEKGRVEIAEHLYRQALSAQPDLFWAAMGLANVCQRDERYDEAARLFKQALEVAQTPSEVSFSRTALASAMAGLGQQAQAEALFEQVIKEDPSYVYAYTELALLYEAFPAPPWEKIISLCETAISLAPGESAWILPKIANAQARLKQLALLLESGTGENDLDVAEQRFAQDATQFAILFRRKKLSTILESHLRDQPLPYVLLLRQLFERVEALGADHFSSLPEFLLYAADFLAGETDHTGERQNVDLALAKRFYELALEGKSRGLARAHAGLLKVCLRAQAFDRAEAAAIRAVAEAGEDPEIVMAAAKVMQAVDRPAIARLLIGRAIELAPDRFVDSLAMPQAGMAASQDPSRVAWADVEVIHDSANNAGARKLGSVEEWLATVAVPGVASKDGKGDEEVGEDVGQVISWLEEFFSLLGETPLSYLLDIDYYRARAGVWFKDADEALLHYLEKGWKDGNSMHAAFDASHVRRQLQQQRVDSSSEPVMLLFLRHERSLDLSPNPLFDPAMYRAGLSEAPERPWFHYLSGGWQQNPNVSPFFDVGRFRKRFRPKPQDALLPPLIFYFCRDTFLDVNGLFHAGFYDSRYRELVKEKAPLAHFISEGAYLGLQPNPFFLPQGKTVQQRLDYLKIQSTV